MQFTSKQILELLDPKQLKNKSGQDIAKVVKILFENPNGLIQKIGSLTTKIQTNRQKQFDIPAIFEIYEKIQKLGKSKEIAKCYLHTLEQLEETGNFKQFMKSKNQMKYFFIMILWNKLFTDPTNNLTLLKCLNLISYAEIYLSYFKNWLNQIDQHYITLMMDSLHQCLTEQLLKLSPDAIVDKKLIPIVQLNMDNICKFIKLIYQSNLQHKRVPKQVFINSEIPKYADTAVQFKLFYNNKKQRSLIGYPFLMPLEYKYELLKIQSIVEQKINIKKNMEGGLGNMINAMVQNENNFSIEGLIYLHFQVNRHNILDDSMEKLGKVKQNLKSPMRISFVGEQGSDEGGVKNQYFQLVTKQIFNPYLDMFLPKHNGRVYWFNGFSYEPPIRFQFVGMLLGLAIYNSVHLNIPFPDLVYKKLLNKQEQEEFSLQLIQDLFDIQPDIYKGLKKILADTEPLDDLELYFTIQLESFGQIVVQELVQEGNMIKVSQDNKVQYCQLYSDYLINKHCKKQFDAFKKGFYKVVSGKMIELFDVFDLRTIIYGHDKIDFKELQQNTAYEGGYDKNTPVVRNLWKLLHSLELQQKKEFLVFVTGSDRVPIQGLKSLGFVIQRHANTQNLPTAHTCFNVFLLPQYETIDKLQKNIRLILKNNQGFGLI